MSCPECIKAMAGPWAIFRAGCKGCQARAVARGPNCWASLRAGKQLPAYRDELRRMELTHEQVKDAATSDWECRRNGDR
jgi:hypothetical protein